MKALPRLVAPLAAAAVLAACTPPPKAETAAAPAALTCAQSLVRTVAFTGADAEDTVEVHALAAPPLSEAAKSVDTTEGGALCHGALVVLSVRHGGFGTVLHTLSAPVGALEMVGEGHAGPPFTPEALAAFLKGWSDGVVISTTKAAPALDPERVTSPLNAAEYEALRKADRPMLCYASGVHDTTCLVSDPEGVGEGVAFVTETDL